VKDGAFVKQSINTRQRKLDYDSYMEFVNQETSDDEDETDSSTKETVNGK